MVLPINAFSRSQEGTPRLITREEVAAWAPSRPIDGHKGTFGRLLIWGGSPGMSGSVCMAAKAALRSGVGIVLVSSPAEIAAPLLTFAPEVLTRRDEGDPSMRTAALIDESRSTGAVLAGPGLDPDDPFTGAAVLGLIRSAPRLVLDAGALTAASRDLPLFRSALRDRRAEGMESPVLTPHPGEFSRINPGWDLRDRTEGARSYAVENSVTLVLKGHDSVISLPDGECYINPTGNDGLAKGGSGDILGGLIGGFLAQRISVPAAVCSAVYFHGLAADFCAEALGKRYMQPTDLFSFLTESYRSCGWE